MLKYNLTFQRIDYRLSQSMYEISQSMYEKYWVHNIELVKSTNSSQTISSIGSSKWHPKKELNNGNPKYYKQIKDFENKLNSSFGL